MTLFSGGGGGKNKEGGFLLPWCPYEVDYSKGGYLCRERSFNHASSEVGGEKSAMEEGRASFSCGEGVMERKIEKEGGRRLYLYRFLIFPHVSKRREGGKSERTKAFAVRRKDIATQQLMGSKRFSPGLLGIRGKIL